MGYASHQHAPSGRSLIAAEIRRLVAGWPWLIAACLLSLAARSEAPGGSNYAWYRVENCHAVGVYVGQNVDSASAEIEQQLRAMRDNGQRRIRLPIFFRRDHPEGSFFVSKDGLGTEDVRRIRDLFDIVRRVGFDEVIVAFFPIGPSYLGALPAWDEDIYQVAVIRQVRAVAIERGLPYILDLLNEALPYPFQTQLLRLTKRLWADYTAEFGAEDTLGFSNTGDAGRLATMRDVYGGLIPKLIDVHLYDEAGPRLKAMAAALRAQGLAHLPWIIGETYYADSVQLEGLRSAAREANVRLLYVLQWPNRRGSKCPVTDSVPIDQAPSLVRPPP